MTQDGSILASSDALGHSGGPAAKERGQPTVVMVSGCFDVLHGGHVEFLLQAKSLGERLVVSVASDESLFRHKGRRSSIPLRHKIRLLESLTMVDEVVTGENPELGLDFQDHFLRIRPHYLVVTEDDEYADKKRALCRTIGA
jgi:cytidyltransferase-like protein